MRCCRRCRWTRGWTGACECMIPSRESVRVCVCGRDVKEKHTVCARFLSAFLRAKTPAGA